MCLNSTTARDAYFAGLFDGEGYVGVRRVSRVGWHGQPTYSLQLNITNTDSEPLLEAQRIWGGSVTEIRVDFAARIRDLNARRFNGQGWWSESA